MENEMYLKLEVIKNNKVVNVFEWTDKAEIWERLAQILWCKEQKRAIRTSFDYYGFKMNRITQTFIDEILGKTTYIYTFENVKL